MEDAVLCPPFKAFYDILEHIMGGKYEPTSSVIALTDMTSDILSAMGSPHIEERDQSPHPGLGQCRQSPLSPNHRT